MKFAYCVVWLDDLTDPEPFVFRKFYRYSKRVFKFAEKLRASGFTSVHVEEVYADFF